MPYRNELLVLPLFLAVSSAQIVYSESLHDYARQCMEATGIEVPAFDCDDRLSTLVPMTNATDKDGNPLVMEEDSNFVELYKKLKLGSGGKCDRPDRLNRECDPGSRFRVLKQTPDAYVVAHCRKKGNEGNTWGDIAVIQHNRKNGATCFYQQGPGDNLPNNVPSPLEVSSSRWQSPPVVAGPSQLCVSCHDNGPIIRSPYLSQITGANQLPGAGVLTLIAVMKLALIISIPLLVRILLNGKLIRLRLKPMARRIAAITAIGWD